MRSFLILLLLFPSVFSVRADEKSAEPPVLKTAGQKVSYGIGLNIGRQLKQQGMAPDPKLIAAGIAAILDDTKPLLTVEELETAFAAYRQEAQEAKAQAALANKKAAEEFLTGNAAKDGVIQTKSGLQYVVLREGTGKTPRAEDSVNSHYRGKLLSGEVFDESYEGEKPTSDENPAKFQVGGVISGWTEALQLMKEGAKFRLFIPPGLAYGEQSPPAIPPNSLLIFDLELIEVIPSKAVKPAPRLQLNPREE